MSKVSKGSRGNQLERGTPRGYKKFDSSLYEKHNGRAIDAVLQYLEDCTDSWAQLNPDHYGPDLVVYQGFRLQSYIEVEVVQAWRGTGSFPWDPVHVLGRKAKFLDLGKPIEFWRLSNDLNRAIVIPDHLLTSGNLEEFRNSLVKEGEDMYHVSLDECIQIELAGEEA